MGAVSPRAEWQVVVGKIAAVLLVFVGTLVFLQLFVFGSADVSECLVVEPGWELVAVDASSGTYLCVQPGTGVYQVDCPVTVVECP